MDPIEHKLRAAPLSQPSRDLDARIAAAVAAAREAQAARRPLFFRPWFSATLAASGLAAAVLFLAFRPWSEPVDRARRFTVAHAQPAPRVYAFEPEGRLHDLLLGPGAPAAPDLVFQVTALPESPATSFTP